MQTSSLRRSSAGSWPEGNITSYSHTAPKLFEARQGIKQHHHVHIIFNIRLQMQGYTGCIAGQRSGNSIGTWQQCSRLERQVSHRAGSSIGITRQATCLWHVMATLVDACELTCLQSFGLLTVFVLACQWNSDLLIAVHATALYSLLATQAVHIACFVHNYQIHAQSYILNDMCCRSPGGAVLLQTEGAEAAAHV